MTGPDPQASLTPAERQVLADAVSLLFDRLPAHQPQQSYSAEGSRLRVLCSCGDFYGCPAGGPDLAREAARLAHVMKAEFRPEEVP